MPAPVIAINPAYNLLFNNMAKTVLLSQLIYWDQRKSLKRWDELWFTKTSDELAEEICHPSSKSVGDWLREFKKMGLIKTRRGFFMGSNQLWMQIDLDKLNELLADCGVSSARDTPSPTPEQSELPNLPQTDFDSTTNLPDTELSPKVSYPTGNSISKITSSKKSDQIDDDSNVIFQELTPAQIKDVTARVASQINSRRMTGSPIRNPQRYLQVALENEAKKLTAKQSTWASLAEDAKTQRDTLDFEPVASKAPQLPELPTDDIWDATVQVLADRWDSNVFSTWIQPTHFRDKDDEKYVIGVPNAYVADYLQFRLYDDVKIALSEVAQRDLELEFVVCRYVR